MGSYNIREELQEAQEVLRKFTADDAVIASIEKAAGFMADAIRAGGKIMSAGNGGSHCDAMHFAEELTGQEGEHYVLSVIHDYNGFHSSLLKFDKRDGSEISAALKAVAKKYPAWLLSAQDEKQKGGFKVGADSSGGKSADDDEKLNKIFGIKKKK